MQEDRKYCSSSFLMYRTVINDDKTFSNKFPRKVYPVPENRQKIHNSSELEAALKKQVEELISSGKKVALCLSGGIDSAILAKFLPKGTKAYTFKCIVPGIEVADETAQAAKYAEECGLNHEIIEIYKEDFDKFTPTLMKHKGAPIHSIEVQIHKAALKAKQDDIDTLIFGESADVLYGGQSMLFGRDWTLGEFIDRYTYVKPYMVLKNYTMEIRPYIEATDDSGYIDVQKFTGKTYFNESMNSYYNACDTAEVEFFAPFSNTIFDGKLDKKLLHAGKNKYLVREVFERLYPSFTIPPKTPMPRPMNEWFKDWGGPTRSEFWPHCTDSMDGDQRWLVWCLEKWLDIIDEKK